jgi:predicted nucleic acid-binding protein
LRLGVDTNVVLRAFNPYDPEHARCLRFLSNPGAEVCATEQTLREIYRVMTGARNGLDLSVEAGLEYVAEARSRLRILAALPASMPIWKGLLRGTGARGLKTHDAYLAAVLLSHGVTESVTLDAGFPDVQSGHDAGTERGDGEPPARARRRGGRLGGGDDRAASDLALGGPLGIGGGEVAQALEGPRSGASAGRRVSA